MQYHMGELHYDSRLELYSFRLVAPVEVHFFVEHLPQIFKLHDTPTTHLQMAQLTGREWTGVKFVWFYLLPYLNPETAWLEISYAIDEYIRDDAKQAVWRLALSEIDLGEDE
jgi:hypothetical protein